MNPGGDDAGDLFEKLSPQQTAGFPDNGVAVLPRDLGRQCPRVFRDMDGPGFDRLAREPS